MLDASDGAANREILAAIPPERRVAVLLRAAEDLFANDRVTQLTDLLLLAPELAVVDAILAALDEEEYTKPRPLAYAALKKRAAGTPVEAAVGARLADKPIPPTAKNLASPNAESELTPLQRAQCAVGRQQPHGRWQRLGER